MRLLNAVIGVSILSLAACQSAPDPIEQVSTYQQLANQHSVERVVQMYADSATLVIGFDKPITGIDRIRGVHEYDRAINTLLHFEGCRVQRRTATCRATETNDWLRAADIARLVYSEVRFGFDQRGRIASITASLTPASQDSVSRVMASFAAWLQQNHPDALAGMTGPDGSFNYGYDTGRRVVALLRAWRAATAQQSHN